MRRILSSAPSLLRRNMTTCNTNLAGNTLQYHHVQLFVKNLQPSAEYKNLEDRLNNLAARTSGQSLETAKQVWTASNSSPSGEFTPHGRDIVQQMLAGLGWRVTGHHEGPSTHSVLVCSPDPKGLQIVVTAPKPSSTRTNGVEQHHHFALENIEKFFDLHHHRQGISTLCFETKQPGQLDVILRTYQEKHPRLLNGTIRTYDDGFRVLEVFAYYDKDGSHPDEGTLLRFVERKDSTILPGIKRVAATFPFIESASYSDHWVSNVIDRTLFLKTLGDTLGFTPKVDFNAGVVGAGEAIIESTVAGNDPGFIPQNLAEGLVNQQQIYLPTNNALSEFGHVHLFLKEIGQGVQHIACRVADAIKFIRQANYQREATGEGFTFLRIPRSYYGVLLSRHLVQIGVTEEMAQNLLTQLSKSGAMDDFGIVNLRVTEHQIDTAAQAAGLPSELLPSFRSVVRLGRYNNLYALLRDHLSEQQYISVVENQLLVDIQGHDILFQIFTAPMMQERMGDEAPFFEFIERVCSQRPGLDGKPVPIKPGCGGFGIRNFLTLFLSIEVTKAMEDLEKANARNDAKAAKIASRTIEAFQEQLSVSNPVLTDISDAMTAESEALAQLQQAKTPQARAEAEKLVSQHQKAKMAGQEELQRLSDHYRNLMNTIRQGL